MVISLADLLQIFFCISYQNFDVDKQLATLLPVWISKASCKQRKGRAGR